MRFAAFYKEYLVHELEEVRVVAELARVETGACGLLPTNLADVSEVAAADAAQRQHYNDFRRWIRFVAMTPAESILGVAFKLILWRREARKARINGGLEQLEDAFVFSAYEDALRLAGLTTLAHPLDIRTAEFIASDFADDDWLCG